MSLIEFWQEVHRTARARRDMRYGQIAFNILSVRRPDLADKVRGTEIDPYYVMQHAFDRRFMRFADFLQDNWE